MGSEVENEKLILIDFWPSVFCMRVKIALAEKGLTHYQTNQVNIMDAKTPQLLNMNPVYEKVPVFIHNGKPVCESLVIVEYIDEVWNRNSPLLPLDPYEKSQARFWADYVDKMVYPTSCKSWTTKGEIKEAAKKEFIEMLKTLEEQLGDKCYFGGDTFGFVDIALIPFYCCFQTYEVSWDICFEAECPKIIAWAKRCLERDTVSSSLADSGKVLEAILEFKKMKGIA